MIQMPAKPYPHVGVGWGKYPVAWLLTYNGANCGLWRHVLKKCMESELCRKLIELLQTIGYSLVKHKCYVDLDVDTEMVEDQAPNQPKHPNHPTTQNHPSSSKHLSPRNKHLLKRSKTKLLNCLVNPQNHPELLPGSWVGLPPTPPS